MSKIRFRDRYLLNHPVNGVVNVFIAINFISYRDLAHMLGLRLVLLCSYKSVAGLQNSGRSFFLSEGAKNGTTCHSSRPVHQQRKDCGMFGESTHGSFDFSNTIFPAEEPHSFANESFK
jgi:hypothetical protein